MREALRGYCWMAAAGARLGARSPVPAEARMAALGKASTTLACPLFAPFAPGFAAHLAAAMAKALAGAPAVATEPACALLMKLGELLGSDSAAPARGGAAASRFADVPGCGAFLESAGALAAGVGAAFAAALGGERRLALLTARAGAAWAPPPPPWEAAGPPPAPAASPRETRALHRAVAVALGALLEAAPRLGGAQADELWDVAYDIGNALRSTLAWANRAAKKGGGGGADADEDADTDADAAAALAELLAARARADAAGGSAAERPLQAGQENLLSCLAEFGMPAKWAVPPGRRAAAPRAAPAAACAAACAAARLILAAGPARDEDSCGAAQALLQLARLHGAAAAWAFGLHRLLDAQLGAALAGEEGEQGEEDYLDDCASLVTEMLAANCSRCAARARARRRRPRSRSRRRFWRPARPRPPPHSRPRRRRCSRPLRARSPRGAPARTSAAPRARGSRAPRARSWASKRKGAPAALSPASARPRARPPTGWAAGTRPRARRCAPRRRWRRRRRKWAR
jgi:hypothetical protein